MAWTDIQIDRGREPELRGSERWLRAKDKDGELHVVLNSKAWFAADQRAYDERRSTGATVTIYDIIERAARWKAGEGVPDNRTLNLSASSFGE